uniref:Glutathione hydrolase n=1 Tax=Wollemia nobilis TaxID=56998 RepID=A0A0C9QUN3_9CONI
MVQERLTAPLLIDGLENISKHSLQRSIARALLALLLATVIAVACVLTFFNQDHNRASLDTYGQFQQENSDIIKAKHGVVAADDERCSDIGTNVLREGGHAVDAAVATALCLGVVNPMSSGLGGGAFMVLRSSTGQTQAFDMRETAPQAASEDMYAKNPLSKKVGPLSMGVPGELAGLHLAWTQHGKLPWKRLVQPATDLASRGFVIKPYLANDIKVSEAAIMADKGLRDVFTVDGKILGTGDVCYNKKLGQTLQAISDFGPEAFYNGSIGKSLVADVQAAGGILTFTDLQNYKVELTDPISAEVMGYTILGMPPPSSGAVGLIFLLNILASYGKPDVVKDIVGLHRTIEALKHMFAERMNLGDPNYVNITDVMSDMLSSKFAEKIRNRIYDNTTFPSEYYEYKYSQLRDNGTSHFCIVDSERNALSMTTTVNWLFGGKMLSPSTGMVLNNEMDDFSIPTDISPDKLPPAPANFIRPNKRPLSSMSPTIVLKDGQLAGVLGGSGGMFIIPAVAQVFINHFIKGMDPLAAVTAPRVFHELIPNVVRYENWTIVDGDHIELSDESKVGLRKLGHELKAMAGGAICQLVVQNLDNPIKVQGSDNQVFYGVLTAVSDPRKDGIPAGF